MKKIYLVLIIAAVVSAKQNRLQKKIISLHGSDDIKTWNSTSKRKNTSTFEIKEDVGLIESLVEGVKNGVYSMTDTVHNYLVGDSKTGGPSNGLIPRLFTGVANSLLGFSKVFSADNAGNTTLEDQKKLEKKVKQIREYLTGFLTEQQVDKLMSSQYFVDLFSEPQIKKYGVKETPEDATDIVQVVGGERGVGNSRVTTYGYNNFAEDMKEAMEETDFEQSLLSLLGRGDKISSRVRAEAYDKGIFITEESPSGLY